MPKQFVHYGLLSTAKIGLNAHLPAARESACSKIISISSRSAETAKAVADKHQIERWYGSYEEQITDPDTDAIINTLPNSMHCEWTVKALEAGKHVLCEKPLGVSVAECRQMIDAAKANNVVLIEGFTHRWNPHLREARRLVTGGAIGRIATIDASFSFKAVEPEKNIRFSPTLGGGSLWDTGCYAIYAARFVMDAEPVVVRGTAVDHGAWGVDTTFAGIMEFENNAIATITSSMDQPFRVQICINGSEGRIEVPRMFDDSGPIIVKMGDGRTKQDERMTATPAPYRFVSQLDEFSECVLKGKAPEFPPEDGLRNTAVISAFYASAASGRATHVSL